MARCTEGAWPQTMCGEWAGTGASPALPQHPNILRDRIDLILRQPIPKGRHIVLAGCDHLRQVRNGLPLNLPRVQIRSVQTLAQRTTTSVRAMARLASGFVRTGARTVHGWLR